MAKAKRSADIEPVELPAETVEIKADKPAVIEVGPRQFLVGLPHQPTSIVSALGHDEAIESYKALNGIIASEHQFAVTELGTSG